MKKLFKQTKVVYDDHLMTYDVYYKNWFTWIHDKTYKFDERTNNPVYYCTREKAEARAIERAKCMLNTVEIWNSRGFNS